MNRRNMQGGSGHGGRWLLAGFLALCAGALLFGLAALLESAATASREFSRRWEERSLADRTQARPIDEVDGGRIELIEY